MASLTEELLDPDLAPEVLLYRLFHEDGVRVRVRPLAVGCRCTREQIWRHPRQPSEELDHLTVEGAHHDLRVCACDFRFDEAEVR